MFLLQDYAPDNSSSTSLRRPSVSTGTPTSSTSSTIPFLSVWERGPASELLFQSSVSRGLATAGTNNVRRSDCGSPSPQSREFLSFLLYLKVTIRVNVLIRVLNYSNFYHITDVTELCDSGKNPPISKRLGIYYFSPFIFSKV